MPIDFFQDQPYQLPGVNIPIKFTPTTGNFVRVWVTDAPAGSKLKALLDQDTFNNRVEVFADETTATWKQEFDVGGAYVLTMQEYQKGDADFQGGYEGDPDTNQTETAVDSEISRKIFIGERMVQKLGTGTHGFADLVLYIWDGTIRQTTIALHDETTPVILNPTTLRAEAAVYNSTVVASVDALIDAATTTLLTNLETMVAEMITEIPEHFNNNGGVWHTAPDTTNDEEIEDLPTDPDTPEGFSRAARILSQRLTLHMQNDANGSARTRHIYPDFENAIIAPSPPPGSSNPTTIWAAIADVYRAYEAHRQLAAVHAIADGTNTLTTALDPLLTIHKDFLEAIQPLSPTAPATANPGVTELAQLGFEIAPR